MSFVILSVDELGITKIELANILRNTGAEVISAKDEIEALNILYENKSKIKIIVWTLNTINDSDFKSIRQIKSKEDYKHIPIVIISKYTGKKHIIKAIQAGAAQFIAKPYDETIILQKFESLLNVPLNKKPRKKIDDDVITFNFADMLNKEIKAASRGKYPLSIMMAAVSTNDAVQAESSEKDMIESVYRVLKTKLRETDSVFLNGSNSLVILLPFAAEEGAKIVEDRIQKLFSTHTLIKSRNTGYKLIATSVCFPEDGRVKQKLLEKLENNLNSIIKVKT